MSTPDKSTAPKNRGWLLTAGGTLLVLAIAGTVNIIAGLSSSRLDWTEYKVHTLTDGTRNIVGKVDTDTTLKFFVSPKDQLPPNLRPLVDQTDSWLARYRELNPKFVRIEKQEVEPATDEEEAARPPASNPGEDASTSASRSTASTNPPSSTGSRTSSPATARKTIKSNTISPAPSAR